MPASAANKLVVNVKKKLPDFTLDISLEAGNEIVAIQGPSGAGKTTLLDLIAGLVRPNQGEISMGDSTWFSSKVFMELPPERRRVGYVFQNYALFPHLTVKKNVLYGKPRSSKCGQGFRYSIIEILELCRITHLQDRYPDQLSGGERQRVALARALMTEPSLLLLDEPLSALDQDTCMELEQELLNIHHQYPMPWLLVTHDRRQAQVMGQRLLFIDRGKLGNQPPY